MAYGPIFTFSYINYPFNPNTLTKRTTLVGPKGADLDII